MRYLTSQLTFQEVPEEISLSLLITGCPLKCRGCHSADAWASNTGKLLDHAELLRLIDKYTDVITCVCFMGGEWEQDTFIQFCRLIKEKNLKICLYTGLEDVSSDIKQLLDYLKTGPYIPEKGGLASKSTNQKFIDLKNGKVLNNYFNTQGGLYDSIGQ